MKTFPLFVVAVVLTMPAVTPGCAELRPDAPMPMSFELHVQAQPIDANGNVSVGPVPQLVQPATPQPPLPTDTVHTMAEWPPKKP